MANLVKVCGIGLMLILNSTTSYAEKQVLELESTIKGNQEQPKVLYIVPWQPQQAPELAYRPLQTMINESFDLIDRDEFRREIKFRRQLNEQQP